MDFFRFFRKKKPVLMRCTQCYYEFEFSKREIRLFESKNAFDPVCPIKEICHICHTGFMIPVKYTHKDGKQYTFHQIKPKIKNLDPNTVMKRMYDDNENEYVIFSGFID